MENLVENSKKKNEQFDRRGIEEMVIASSFKVQRHSNIAIFVEKRRKCSQKVR